MSVFILEVMRRQVCAQEITRVDTYGPSVLFGIAIGEGVVTLEG